MFTKLYFLRGSPRWTSSELRIGLGYYENWIISVRLLLVYKSHEPLLNISILYNKGNFMNERIGLSVYGGKNKRQARRVAFNLVALFLTVLAVITPWSVWKNYFQGFN